MPPQLAVIFEPGWAAVLAGVAVWRKAPFVVVVVLAATTTTLVWHLRPGG